MRTRPPPKILLLWLVLLLTGLYALVGLVVILATVWRPLPDYPTLQAKTLDAIFFELIGAAVLYMLLTILPNPHPQRGWTRIRAYLVPWGVVQLALCAYCLLAIATLPPVASIGQQDYQAVVLRSDGILCIAIATGIAAEIYRRLASVRRNLSN